MYAERYRSSTDTDPGSAATNLYFEGEALINSFLLTLCSSYSHVAIWQKATTSPHSHALHSAVLAAGKVASQSIALWNLFTKACGYRNKAKPHQKCCAWCENLCRLNRGLNITGFLFRSDRTAGVELLLLLLLRKRMQLRWLEICWKTSSVTM